MNETIDFIISICLTFGLLIFFIIGSLFIFSLGYASKQDSPYEEWKRSIEKNS